MPVDQAALAARIRAAVAAVVEQQVAAGIDIVNDGEMSKPSYATYIKDRLAGFGGESRPLVYQDLVEFPEFAGRVFGDPGRCAAQDPRLQRPDRGPRPSRRPDRRRQSRQPRRRRRTPAEGFLTAASPGVVSLFFHNGHYPTRRGLSLRDRRGDAAGIRDRRRGRLCPAARLPRSRDGPAHPIRRARASPNSATRRGCISRSLNHALANIPADRMRLHLCWGNYEGPHHCDVPLADIIEIVLPGEAARAVVRGGQPAPCA